MRKFEVDGTVITEKEILEKYWKTWSEAMWLVTQDPMDINEEDCITDWVIANDAVEVNCEDC